MSLPKFLQKITWNMIYQRKIQLIVCSKQKFQCALCIHNVHSRYLLHLCQLEHPFTVLVITKFDRKNDLEHVYVTVNKCLKIVGVSNVTVLKRKFQHVIYQLIMNIYVHSNCCWFILVDISAIPGTFWMTCIILLQQNTWMF